MAIVDCRCRIREFFKRIDFLVRTKQKKGNKTGNGEVGRRERRREASLESHSQGHFVNGVPFQMVEFKQSEGKHAGERRGWGQRRGKLGSVLKGGPNA